MDILVLDAPMKFIHGKMVKQGAKEWSRYLSELFNPIGRGTLYKSCFNKESGLTIYLYSAAITLECVGEQKGYLKVIKAYETDVMAYHTAIEEEKLIEEQITFVPVYKFQYINTKEHHDVERFIEIEESKEKMKDYLRQWHEVAEKLGGQETEVATDRISRSSTLQEAVEETIHKIYLGKAAHPRLKSFILNLENVRGPIFKDIDIEGFTPQYELLSNEQKDVLERALSIEDLYLINQPYEQTVILVREMVEQMISQKENVLLVAADEQKLQELLEVLSQEKDAHVAALESLAETAYEKANKNYTLSKKLQVFKKNILEKLEKEAYKYSKHKEELEGMKEKCELFQEAEETLLFIKDSCALLEENGKHKEQLEQERQSLESQIAACSKEVAIYDTLPQAEHHIYAKLKVQLQQQEDLYRELLWMKDNGRQIEYEKYKELIISYGKQVKLFDERLSTYKKQMNARGQYEIEYKFIEGKLLELRRQYLNQQALKQVDRNSGSEDDEAVKEEINKLEERLKEIDGENELAKTGLITKRSLDELKAEVYRLKDEVEAYMETHSQALKTLFAKEEVTKGEVIEAFKRMRRVEALFGENIPYEIYLQGMEAYFKLEETVLKHKQLLKALEEKKAQLEELHTKQNEVKYLLISKIEEQPFKAFLELVENGQELAKEILENPLMDERSKAIEGLEKAVQQREYKLNVYKEKVAYYEEMGKLKSDWQAALSGDQEDVEAYLMSKINVVGATCQGLVEYREQKLVNRPFEYVIICGAEQFPNLELLIPMIKGKKMIIMGQKEEGINSLFSKIYMDCPPENKYSLGMEER